MILEFSCKNFKSIKDKVIFSMIASTDKSLPNNIVEFGKYKVLNAAAIYGANGSGKSSFIQCINFFRALIINSVNHQPGDKIIDYSFKTQLNEPNEFKIQFVTQNKRYAYGFTLLNNKFTEEYLYCFPNGTQKKIFERIMNNVELGPDYSKNMEASKSTLKDNRLFLSCAANFSDQQEITDVFMFFKNTLVIYSGRANDWLNYSVSTLQNNENYKNLFLKFMGAIGSNILDIEAKKDRRIFSKIEMPIIIPEELKSILLDKEVDILDVKINHKDFMLKLTEESIGTQKLFAIMCPIIDIVLKGKIFICDEIETSLHPNIVIEIIKLFINQDKTHFSQIIFTTHDENLLDLNLLRRDQIWFTELNNSYSTDLYSLSELKNVRKDENISKGYLIGKYGAIPIKNNEQIKLIFKGNNAND